MGLLSTVIFLPAAAGLVLALFARRLSAGAVKTLGLAAAVTAFVFAIGFLPTFVPGQGFQFAEHAAWIPSLGVSYAVGIDGIGLLMVLLTTALTPLALLAGWRGATESAKGLTILMLFLETAMLGVFSATDLFLFYVFWEASLIPMYVIIGAWGGPRRLYATVKFFLFTMAGSVLMLVAIVWLGLQHQAVTGTLTFDAASLAATPLALPVQRWLFWAFVIAFLVKVPAVPVHTWLPDAHVEAPTAGSVILAGVLLKMGGYGLLRYGVGMFPAAAAADRMFLVGLGVVAILYGAGMVMVQRDLKRLIAYSSVSHMGYVVAGIGSLTAAGLSGGIMQMISHGFAAGALFACVGILYDRTHTRDLGAYGGVAKVLPHFAWAFLAVTLASIGLPGTSGFVGEFLALLGVSRASFPWAVAGAGGVILGAVYMLSMFRAVMHGPATGSAVGHLAPLDLREAASLAIYVGALFVLGIWPQMWLNLIGPDVAALVARAGVG